MKKILFVVVTTINLLGNSREMRNNQREAIAEAIHAGDNSGAGDKARFILEKLMSCHQKSTRTIIDEFDVTFNKKRKEECSEAVVLLDEYADAIKEKIDQGEKDKEKLLSRVTDIRSYYFDNNLHDLSQTELAAIKGPYLSSLAEWNIVITSSSLPNTPFFNEYKKSWKPFMLRLKKWLKYGHYYDSKGRIRL